MSNISCYVIQDLLPSYMDGIASDDSVKLVEAHLAECGECRDFKNRMENPKLHIADKDVSLDYMKKIRKLTDLKSAACFFLVLITGFFFLEYTKYLHQPKPFFILVALMLLCNYLLFFQNHKIDTVRRMKTMIPNVVGILLVFYMMLIMQLSIYNWLHDKNAPFYIDYADLGPFLHHQLIFVMVVEIVLWIRELVLHIRKSRFSIICSSFGIIGFYMALYYARMLKLIESLDSFRVINNNAFILFVEGIGILLLLFVIEKINNSVKG